MNPDITTVPGLMLFNGLTQDDVRDVFREARNLIAEGGWTQGSYHALINGIPCYCLMGALHRASTVKAHSVVIGRIADRVANYLEPYYISIVTINDLFIQSKEEALRFLDRMLEVELSEVTTRGLVI